MFSFRLYKFTRNQEQRRARDGASDDEIERRRQAIEEGGRRPPTNYHPLDRSFARSLGRVVARTPPLMGFILSSLYVHTCTYCCVAMFSVHTYLVYGVLQHLLYSDTSTIRMGFGMNILKNHSMKSRKRNHSPPLPARKCRHMNQR